MLPPEDSEIAGEAGERETPARKMLESLQEGWKGPLPHPMPTYNPVTGKQEKTRRKYPTV